MEFLAYSANLLTEIPYQNRVKINQSLAGQRRIPEQNRCFRVEPNPNASPFA